MPESNPYENDPAIRCIQVTLRILQEEIYPRVLEDMPTARSDKQRAALRVTRNYTAECIDRCEKTLRTLNQPIVFTNAKGMLETKHNA